MKLLALILAAVTVGTALAHDDKAGTTETASEGITADQLSVTRQRIIDWAE